MAGVLFVCLILMFKLVEVNIEDNSEIKMTHHVIMRFLGYVS